MHSFNFYSKISEIIFQATVRHNLVFRKAYSIVLHICIDLVLRLHIIWSDLQLKETFSATEEFIFIYFMCKGFPMHRAIFLVKFIFQSMAAVKLTHRKSPDIVNTPQSLKLRSKVFFSFNFSIVGVHGIQSNEKWF